MIKRRPSCQTATPLAVVERREPKGADVGERIGRELRAMFEGVVAEPVPEKFRQLLDELERKPARS